MRLLLREQLQLGVVLGLGLLARSLPLLLLCERFLLGLLQALLDLPTPEYRHHRLLTDPEGRRYAKRDRGLTLRALREAGRTPAEIRSMVGL